MVEYTKEMQSEYDKQLLLMMKAVIRFPAQFAINGKRGMIDGGFKNG